MSVRGVIDTGSTLLVCVVAAGVLWRTYGPQRNPTKEPPVQTVKNLQVNAGAVRHSRGNGPVALIEFSDFECPFCGRYTRDTAPRIKQTLVETGMVREIVFNYPLSNHAKAQKAGEAAECAGKQGKLWVMRDAMFADQQLLAEPDLLRTGGKLGLDSKALDDCLRTGEMAAAVKRDLDEGRRLGVNSTPTFFVGLVQGDGSIRLLKKLKGALDFSVYDSTLRSAMPTTRSAVETRR